jgi:peptidoglycan/LPS O-acetylase OafA/YrhL
VFIDSLRGLAAIGVVACHFVPDSSLVPWLVEALMRKGSLGVQVFFVISGFVIAYSVRGTRINARYLGNFALRRSLRLDPPYWATIACILLLAPLTHQLAPQSAYHGATVPQVLAHLAYIQNFLGYPDLCVVFWTLRLEVMFYVAFIILLGVAQRLGKTPDKTDDGAWRYPLMFIPLALLSLVAFTLQRGPGVLQYFHMFLLGALLWWTYDRRVTVGWLVTLLGAMGASLAFRMSWEVPVAITTALAVYATGRAGRLTTWLDFRPLQYLGRISYSLYLIHAPVGGLVVAVGLCYGESGPLASIVWNVLGVLVAFAAAEVLYHFVEAPSLAWARRFKRPGRPAVAAGFLTSASA